MIIGLQNQLSAYNFVLQLTNRIMPFWEMLVVYCKNPRKGINISDACAWADCSGSKCCRLWYVLQSKVTAELATATEWLVWLWPAEECVCRRAWWRGCEWSICASSRLSLGYVDTRTMPVCDGRKSTYCSCNESKPGHTAFWLQQGKLRNSITSLAKHPHSDRFLFQNRKQLLLIQRGSCVWMSSGQDGASVLACVIYITGVSVLFVVVTDRK